MRKYLVVAWAASAGLALITPGLAAGQEPPGAENLGGPNAVIAWNAYAVEAAVAACLSPIDNPLHESRLYAMTHLAIHDALNAIDRRYRPYGSGLPREAEAAPAAAVASAARNVLVPTIQDLPASFAGCIPAGVQSVEANYTAALAAIPDGDAKEDGIELGRAAASTIVAARADDGSDTPLVVEDCPQDTAPGEYQCTPGTPFLFAPGWGGVDPFVLREAAQFRPGPPPALTSRQYTKDFNEVKRLGGDDATTASDRTAEQTEIARFWLESSPSQWNRIARTVAGARGLGQWQSARLFALLNMAMADGYVGTFETKYLYNFWRPVTAIREADRDGNSNTVADPDWTPLVGNPPIPDYDSGHSVEGGAAAQVMKRVFGTDRVTFSVCSLTLPAGSTCSGPSPISRSYTSFTQAAEENGLSRILVGFHFRTAVRVGIDHGRQIANRALDRFLQPAG